MPGLGLPLLTGRACLQGHEHIDLGRRPRGRALGSRQQGLSQGFGRDSGEFGKKKKKWCPFLGSCSPGAGLVFPLHPAPPWPSARTQNPDTPAQDGLRPGPGAVSAGCQCSASGPQSLLWRTPPPPHPGSAPPPPRTLPLSSRPEESTGIWACPGRPGWAAPARHGQGFQAT